MTYPAPPWRLRGRALVVPRLVDIHHARPLVPRELAIVPVLPGKTLGLVYLARYGSGSSLQYNELIVAPALARYRARPGFWISHIYVDNPASMAGGREVWGLPKEMAEFTWTAGAARSIVVSQGERRLCTVHQGHLYWLPRAPLLVPAFGMRDSALLWFTGAVTAGVGVGRAMAEISPESPFAGLGMDGRGLAFHCRDMKFVAHAPVTAGHVQASGQPAASRRSGQTGGGDRSG